MLVVILQHTNARGPEPAAEAAGALADGAVVGDESKLFVFPAGQARIILPRQIVDNQLHSSLSSFVSVRIKISVQLPEYLMPLVADRAVMP
ncbi:hypothetical protein D3C75_681700 [compost metagenome]